MYLMGLMAMPYEKLIVDNSPREADMAGAYRDAGLNWLWVNPKGKDHYQFMCESQNKIREYFLEGDYTHLFFLESDVVCEPSLPDYFAAYKVPVIGAQYFIYKGEETIAMSQTMDTGYAFGHTRNLSLEESFMHISGDPVQAYSIGFGAVLIERGVLEIIKFRSVPDGMTQGVAHADSFFYNDCARNVVDVYLHTGITVKHYNQDWSKINFLNPN
jgi:hypothetical protein